MMTPEIREVLADPAVHDYVKDMLRRGMEMDPIDAAFDAQLVARLLMTRVDVMLHEAESAPMVDAGAGPCSMARRGPA